MNISKIKKVMVLSLSSGLGTGYLPKMPGTWGSLLASGLLYGLSPFEMTPYVISTLFVILLGAWVCQKAGEIYGVVDDSKIVIDEIAGIMVTMIGIPLSLNWLIWGFLAFRTFDILKPPPANIFDRSVKNGWGVMLDDVVAGIYANLILQLGLHLV